MKKTRRAAAFPIVGIGASAGGLKAFSDLLNAVPPEPGMAFVLVPHLAPQYKSHLTEILARKSRLKVTEVRDGEAVAPNRVYVVPSNRAMVIKRGVLRLSPSGRKSDRHAPIDGFFRSLADDQRALAIGVLLSGTGTDGTDGLRAIQAGGGTTYAQDGESAAYLGMPQSAVVSGCVDFVLDPEEIGRRLLAGETRKPAASGSRSADEEDLNRIFDLLRTAKGVDLLLYKRSTLRRRIQRRMSLTRIRGLRNYLRALKGDPAEVQRLFSEILIGVTCFFREPESFRALKAVVYPRILRHRPSGAPIRIWIPGCSTGEEAYSHAMNLVEFLGKRASEIPFQVFATDVNPGAVETARAGYYTKKMLAGVTPDRLRRFFIEAEDGFRIAPFIRERCVFAVQNVVQDPPFMNMDLISCRNLLIYLSPALQEKALQVFQYALKPRAVLMLGRSESAGDFAGRFTPLDVKKKVFSVRTPGAKSRLEPVHVGRFLETEAAFKDVEGAVPARTKLLSASFDLQGSLDRFLPARYLPNGVIVNGELEILRFLGNTTSYLRPAPGKPSMNLRRMASGELLLELRAAIHVAKESGGPVSKEITAPHASGAPRRARIEVLPIAASKAHKGYFLVLFEEIVLDEGLPRAGASRRGKDSRRVLELKEDLAISGGHLKAIIEEQESTNERLKSSNEDLLSSNEELQSINEEYETTKEELQSTNEELLASTEEVGRGNLILSRANNDLSNFLANIDIPIVMLDLDLAVRRFTPAAEKALGLSPDQIGRPLADLKLPLRLPDLKPLLAGVLKTGDVRALEVQDAAGRWHYLFLRPYRTDKSRTEKSRIEGVVLALIDIHERKIAEKTVVRLATLVLDSNDAVIVCDLRDRIIAWNKGAQRMYGYTETQALGMSIRRLMPKDKLLRAKDLLQVSAPQIEIQRRTRDGRVLDVLVTVTVLRDARNQPVEVATTERDITEKKRDERAREISEKMLRRLAAVVLDSNDAVILADLAGRITAWNQGAQKMYGYTEIQALSMNIRRLMPEGDRISPRELMQLSGAPMEIKRRAKSGRVLDVLRTVTVLRGEDGQPVEIAKTERDITAQKRAHSELRRLHARVISAQETERKRLARELHDGVGQILSGVKYRLQALPGKMSLSGGAEAKLLKVGGFLDHAISEIRRVSQNLMPAELVDLGLEAALLTLCREFKERTDLQLTVRTVPVVAGPDQALALFRIAQEALNNVGKHSKATMAAVALSVQGKDIILSVSDNGAGFRMDAGRAAAGRGVGLGSMRERAESIGGRLEVHSTRGAGTTLSVRAPAYAVKGILP